MQQRSCRNGIDGGFFFWAAMHCSCEHHSTPPGCRRRQNKTRRSAFCIVPKCRRQLAPPAQPFIGYSMIEATMPAPPKQNAPKRVLHCPKVPSAACATGAAFIDYSMIEATMPAPPKQNAPKRVLHCPKVPSAACATGAAFIDYSMIEATMPAPTVRPPSRMAKRSFSSIAIGTISVTSAEMLSPGITISVPSGSVTTPVTSVVRK